MNDPRRIAEYFDDPLYRELVTANTPEAHEALGDLIRMLELRRDLLDLETRLIRRVMHAAQLAERLKEMFGVTLATATVIGDGRDEIGKMLVSGRDEIGKMLVSGRDEIGKMLVSGPAGSSHR